MLATQQPNEILGIPQESFFENKQRLGSNVGRKRL